jgi:hypothetical protein
MKYINNACTKFDCALNSLKMLLFLYQNIELFLNYMRCFGFLVLG